MMKEERWSSVQAQPHTQHLESPKVSPTVGMELSWSDIQRTQYHCIELVQGKTNARISNNFRVHKNEINRRRSPTVKHSVGRQTMMQSKNIIREGGI